MTSFTFLLYFSSWKVCAWRLCSRNQPFVMSPRTRAATPPVRCSPHAGIQLHSVTCRRYNKASLLVGSYSRGHIPGSWCVWEQISHAVVTIAKCTCIWQLVGLELMPNMLFFWLSPQNQSRKAGWKIRIWKTGYKMLWTCKWACQHLFIPLTSVFTLICSLVSALKCKIFH